MCLEGFGKVFPLWGSYLAPRVMVVEFPKTTSSSSSRMSSSSGGSCGKRRHCGPVLPVLDGVLIGRFYLDFIGKQPKNTK